MFWADRISEDIEKALGSRAPLMVRDEKTLSGRVHVGSMRGVAIHAAVAEALAAKGVANAFKYEFNDFDPMDDIPSYLDQDTYKRYLGMPLKHIPSPDGSAANFAEYFGAEFRSVIEDAGWSPEFYRSSELYEAGKMDGVIREALEHPEDIRRIYKEVSGGQREDTWLPLSVVCPQCGKMTTTEASDFDGTTVSVHCSPTKVAYTQGCDFKGRVSPFGGKAKLPWKVEWAAKWKVVGVDIEGGGKDHSTRGGSRDVANHISREVFKRESPFDIPYEFFLVGGQKMSSSKGRGSSAKEISDLLPAKIFRLALLSKEPMHAFSFDPEGDTIPILFDLYDKLALGYWAGVRDGFSRLFEFVHPGHKTPTQSVLPRFSQVAFMVQMPHLDIYKEFPEADKAELDERAAYAKRWLDTCAPEKYVFKLQEQLPETAKTLTGTQKSALASLKEFIESRDTMPSGEEIQAKLHETKEFKAAYLAFLGKESGPKAGWFISVLDRDFVLKRLAEASV